MALTHLHFFSPILDKHVAADVILPEVGEGPFATFYLLHGLSDDHTIWQRRTRIEEYVKDLPLAVVMPDGFRGFYTNTEPGQRFADYMAKDVVGTIERHFNVRKDRAGRCIGGLSMGGYGALRLALGFPELFCSATSHSGCLMIGSIKTRPGNREFMSLFGRDPRGSEHDLIELAKRAQKKKKLPHIRIDCGTRDFLIESNRAIHRTFTEMHVAHEYEEFAGAHTWDYWDLHVREAIAFHARALKLKVE